MPIRSVKELADAYDAGQFHTQRFLKNSGVPGDGHWMDWAYASGQPAYDARVGTALTCTPQSAVGNDAIWFPGIQAGQERYLSKVGVTAIAAGADQTNVELRLYDLLAVYPLIDGDSTDTQVMDNAQTITRYTSGEGVMAVMVNHIAPGISNASFTINYTNNMGNSRQMTGLCTTFGVNKAAWTISTSGTSGPLYLPLDARCRGIQTIDDITFSSAPGGLWCIYLVKPLMETSCRGGVTGATQTVWTEKDLASEDGMRLARIYDGASIGAFYMPTGGSRSTSFFGSMTFVWG